MQKISRTHLGRGHCFALFLLFACFANHGRTWPGLGMKAFGTSRRFSPWLWRSSGGFQLPQKGWHGPSHLRQRPHRAPSFPGPIASHHQGTSQDQLVMGTRHHLAPAFRSFWRTQPWHIPEHHLLVEAIAMLVRVTQAIGRADLGQRSRFLALPDKPTDLWVTSLATGSVADDLDNRDVQRACSAQVQVLPTSRSALIWPSSNASYKLAHVRSKNGESDNSGKLCAPASLESASTRLNRASLAFPKQPYIS
jgi:hypothetical protein